LPAPDIEIGLRHPVNYTLPRYCAGNCDPFHNRQKNAGRAGARGCIQSTGFIKMATI
jgi:hypothetical protein